MMPFKAEYANIIILLKSMLRIVEIVQLTNILEIRPIREPVLAIWIVYR